MSTLRTEDSDASERELLVDEIQRIRDVLHGGADKISSDEEGDDGSEEDEDEAEKCGQRLIGAMFKDGVLKAEDVGKQSPLNTIQETISPHADVSSLQGDNYLMPLQSTANTSSDEYTVLELQPANYQPTTSTFSTSHPFNSVSSDVNNFANIPNSNVPFSIPLTTDAGCTDGTRMIGTNQFYDGNDADNQEDDEEELFFDQVKENDNDFEMRNEIQRCLHLNRDYQLVVLDELERIELALAKNREKQFGLHQMRASKDEGKPEPQTLIKFGNPYFKDAAGVGPPDNDDTKMKRQSSQVGGYQVKQKAWNDKEIGRLAEGVRMQNLENKLSPILQRIQTLELKKTKTVTNTELQELEDLKAESSRIKILPKEKHLYDLEGIDWDKISSTYVPKRSGFQCRLQWCNFGHPDVNRMPWTKEEDKKLLQLAKDPQNTWVTIAQKLQTKRTPIHCYERYQRSLNKNLLKSKWTPEDDKQLLEVVRVVGLGNWPRVASFLEGRQGDQCLHRYTQTLQMVRKGKWTPDEDELLKKGIEKYGTCWNKLSEVVPSRSGPQCRERWVNALDPKIDKGPWTPEQDRKLLENVEKLGKGNWSQIARALGNRTDNQCWRRWIVLRKDDFLYYRQNTLRKKRELVSNFTGRRQERPELEPEDLDIPDVPVVKKGKPGRVPLPPEVSRERRRLTRAKSREKKRAEKRRADEEARERSTRKKRQVQYTEIDESGEDEEEEDEGMADDDEDSLEVSTEEKQSHRNRKAGRNRTRVQQPHHRVLMKNKQLSKRKEVAQKRQERQTETAAGEKTVTVSGALGPFSLLLQAFSIDIPTVLQAIQTTSGTPSTSPPPSGTNVSSVAATTAGVGKGIAGNEKEVQPGDNISNQVNQEMQTETSEDSAMPQVSTNTETVVGDVTVDRQCHSGQENREQAQLSREAESQLLGDKRNESGSDKPCKSAVIDPTVGAQNISAMNSGTLNIGRAEVGTGSTGAAPTTAAKQTSQRRAPAIPPLPPCYTTLRTFKSLLMLRPQLQRIAAMLNPTPGNSTAGAQACQHSPVTASGSHSNSVSRVSHVTYEARDKSYNGQEQSPGNVEKVIEQSENVLSGKDGGAINEARCNNNPSGVDHVVPRECTRDIQADNKHTVSAKNVVSDDSSTKLSDVTTASDSGRTEASETTSPNDSTQLDGDRDQVTGDNNNRALLGQAKPSETTLSCAQGGCARGNVEGLQMIGNYKALPEQVKPSEALTERTEARVHSCTVENDRETATTSDEGMKVRSNSTRVSAPGTPPLTGTRFYRNSYEYKMLSSRFNSLFLWPALLSKIPVRFTSQIGPVFVQRHPPPKGISGAKDNEKPPATRRRRRRLTAKPTVPVNPKRKHPGLAAVRMASSTSFTTPAQQMCTVGQSAAIRKERTPQMQLDADPSGTNEVVFAASQLVSLHEATRSLKESSTSAKRPYNSRTSGRKSVPVKRIKRVIESSNSSSEDDPEDVDFLPAPNQRKISGSGAVRNTRQTSARNLSLSGSAKSVSFTQDTSAVAAENRNDTITGTRSFPVVILSSDSASEAPLSALQEEQSDTAGQHSSAAANHSNNSPSPSKSSKRKNPRPEKNRGARWRAMLPTVPNDNSDA